MRSGRVNQFVVTLVEDADEVVLQRERGDLLEHVGGINHAGRIVRRVENDAARFRSDEPREFFHVDLKIIVNGWQRNRRRTSESDLFRQRHPIRRGNDDFIANLQSHIASNPCNLVQYAALEAFVPENDSFVAGNLKQLTAQRTTALQLIGKIPGLPCVVPDGAFYLFPDVSSLFNKSFKGQRVENVDCLAEMLLEHAHIAIVPGSAFGADQNIRISYAIPTEEIITGLTRLENFVQLLT